jgi:hypothetical protein
MDSTKRAETADQTPLPYEANALNILFVSCLELAYSHLCASEEETRAASHQPSRKPRAHHSSLQKMARISPLLYLFSAFSFRTPPAKPRRPGEFTLYLAHRPDICFDPRFEVKCHLLGFQPKAARLAFFSISITHHPM